jgi:hypothetical protein
MLLNDGSHGDSEDKGPSLVAPDKCQPTTSNYAVDLTIQILPNNNGSCGIDFRGGSPNGGWAGYSAYFDPGGLNLGAQNPGFNWRVLSAQGYSVGNNSHTFRVTAVGNVLSVLIDGARIIQVTDNVYLLPGQIGMWCNAQVQVTNFKVTVLA